MPTAAARSAVSLFPILGNLVLSHSHSQVHRAAILNRALIVSLSLGQSMETLSHREYGNMEGSIGRKKHQGAMAISFVLQHGCTCLESAHTRMNGLHLAVEAYLGNDARQRSHRGMTEDYRLSLS